MVANDAPKERFGEASLRRGNIIPQLLHANKGNSTACRAATVRERVALVCRQTTRLLTRAALWILIEGLGGATKELQA